MDGLAFHPYADSSGQSPDTPHPNSTTIGLADYDRLMRTLSTAFDNTPQAGLAAAGPLRRVRGRVEDPGREAEGLHRGRAADDEARRRDHAGRLLRARPPARVLPAERRRHPPLPLAGRACACELAVGRLLRGRNAEVEPLRRPRRALAVARRLDRAVRGPRARRHGHQGRVSVTGRPRPWHAGRPLHLHARLCLGAARARRGERRHAPSAHGLRPRGPAGRRLAEGRKLGTGQVRFSLTLSSPVNPGAPQVQESTTVRLG